MPRKATVEAPLLDGSHVSPLEDPTNNPSEADDDHGSLRLAHCCYRHLSWDYVVDENEKAAVPELCDHLATRGYRDESRVPWLHQLAHEDGHSVIIVPRTGRVQIRVHYLTPPPRRAACATQVANDLGQALTSLFERHQPGQPTETWQTAPVR